MSKLAFSSTAPVTTSRRGGDPDVKADANRSLRHYIDITQTAERALFDFVFTPTAIQASPDDPESWKRKTDSNAA